MSKEKGFTEIGKRLHSVRGELDQRGFSRVVNVSQQAISNYERGNLPASWGFLRRLNEEFNVNLNWLFTGQGLRDHRSGTPYASLADNRPPGWPRAFVEQVAFDDVDVLELLLPLYFLYLATEPADAKARLMADLQAVVDAQREHVQGPEAARPAGVPIDLLDALAADDRRRILTALFEVGHAKEAAERGRDMREARRAYLAALGLAQMQGWVEEEVEAARRVGRTYRKEGRWSDAERFFHLSLSRIEGDAARGEHGAAKVEGVSAGTIARTYLGYGHVAKHQGRIAEARERYTAALRWALKSQEPGLRAEVYIDLTCLAVHEKEWQKAMDFITSGRAFADQAGDARLSNNYRVLEALVLHERGELEAAETILRVLLKQAETARDLHLQAIASGNLAEVLVDRGATDQAEELLRRTAATAEDHSDPRDLALRKVLVARIEAAKGEEGAARARFMEALRFARDHGLTREFEQAASAFERIAGSRQPTSASHAG
jgi:tetratricopeptide (TPR) repeat protein